MSEANKESKKNSEIQDLRAHLFDALDRLKKREIDIDDAKAIVGVAQVIVDSAKVEVEFIKAVGGIATGTGFIPLEPPRPALGEGNKEKPKD